ncbi:MAG: DUF3841 domain-containing protein [Bacillota bacterium]
MKNMIKLWSHQNEKVREFLLEEERITVKRKFIKDKYGEQAEIFLKAYDFFVAMAEEVVKRPEDAEYPYWAAIDRETASAGTEGVFLRLEVPEGKAVFFSDNKWNRILNLEYLPADDEDENRFNKKLESMGLGPGTTSDILLTPHYPLLKKEIEESWQRNFEIARKPGEIDDENVKAALWELKSEWLV